MFSLTNPESPDTSPFKGLSDAKAEQFPVPRMKLVIGSVVRIAGRECIVERRLANSWQLLTLDKEPLFFTDEELIELQRDGSFYLLHQPGTRDDITTPPSPLNFGPQASAENERRLAYVLACLHDPAFRRSRRVLKPIITKCFEQRKEQNPTERVPSFTSVLNWIDRYKKYGAVFGAAALADRSDRKGRRGERLAPYQLDAISAGLKVWLARNTKANAYKTVLAEIYRCEEEGLVDKTALAAEFLDDEGHLVPPSLRTFERRCDQVGSLMANAMRVGLRYAKRNGRTFGTMPLPEYPYQYVEVDHCTMDIALRIKDGPILGRPNLVVFRDRATSAIIGWSLGYNYPSYAAFVLGLKRTMYGLEPNILSKVNHPLPGPGRIENLITDNGKEFIGDDIKHAAAQLGINLIPLPPRQPWLKGQVEAWFRKASQGAVRMLPGATLENAIAKRDFEMLGGATLTVDQFETLLARWISDEYNVRPTKTLGFVRGFNDGTTPLEAWKAKANGYEIDPLPHPDVFMALAGLTEKRSIQRNGISIGYIVYEGAVLATIMANPGYRSANSRGGATLITVMRDPHNLGHVQIIDPFTKQPRRLDACVAHQSYANGLTLDEHKVIVARANEQRKSRHRTNFRELIKIAAELNEFALRLSSAPSYKTTQRRLAAFLEGNRLRPQRSKIEIFPSDGTDYLDFTVARNVTSALTNPEHAILTEPHDCDPLVDGALKLTSHDSETDTDDISALRAEKNWE